MMREKMKKPRNHPVLLYCFSLVPSLSHKHTHTHSLSHSLSLCQTLSHLTEMAEAKPPLFHMHAMSALFHIPQREPPQLQDAKWSGDFRDFLSHCLVKEPNERWTAEKLLKVSAWRLSVRECVCLCVSVCLCVCVCVCCVCVCVCR